jgi:hypothetical protein
VSTQKGDVCLSVTAASGINGGWGTAAVSRDIYGNDFCTFFKLIFSDFIFSLIKVEMD